MDRRTFLSRAGAAALGLSLARSLEAFPAWSPYLSTIGLQLWTVRDQLAANTKDTLKAVAEAGYRQVELIDVLKSGPVIEAAKENGLGVSSAFIDWNIIAKPDQEGVPKAEEAIAAATRHGLEYLVFGYIGKGSRESADQFKTLADDCNRFGALCKAAGLQLCYHNHSFEFQPLEGGQAGYDIFVDRFDHELVKFELDVFWAEIGGRNPVELLNRLEGRVAQVHLKDLQAGHGRVLDKAKVPPAAFEELGDGVIDLQAVLRAAEKAGVHQCHVEQDHSPDPLESVRKSLAQLRIWNGISPDETSEHSDEVRRDCHYGGSR